MKRLMTAVFVAMLALTFAMSIDARRTYTFEEIEAMKKAGKLRGNERFAIIAVEDGNGLTGGPAARANLIPAADKSVSDNSVKGEAMDAIAYDKVTTTRFLTTMAREYYGNHEFWTYIYEENKSKLGFPDKIPPGTMIIVPNLKKYGVDPKNPADVEKAKRLGKEIFARYGK